ncbi:MAG: DUF4440 domain-containing protein [Pseudomonadota bacterium]
MRRLILIAALLVASPAVAIPPVGPRTDEAAVVEAYAVALARSDLPAFRSLIADDAKIINEAGKVVEKNDWLATAEIEFPRTRQMRILGAFSGYTPFPGTAIRRFMFVTEFTRCHPNAVECFPRWRTETITISGGRVIELQTSSDFDLRRSAAGVWTFYD